MKMHKPLKLYYGAIRYAVDAIPIKNTHFLTVYCRFDKNIKTAPLRALWILASRQIKIFRVILPDFLYGASNNAAAEANITFIHHSALSGRYRPLFLAKFNSDFV